MTTTWDWRKIGLFLEFRPLLEVAVPLFNLDKHSLTHCILTWLSNHKKL